MAFLRLGLLGGFEATPVSSGTPVVLPTKKAQALLAYCALRSDQAHQREKLATLLWGETREANARNSLRQTLYGLRAALGESLSSVLRIERDTIGVDLRAIDVDVLSFERLAAERTPESLEQAMTLYRGDLLDGFVVDEDPFEEWLLQERERLRDLAMETLARLLQHQRVEGQARAAIQTARRLLALDPLQEAVYQILMRLFLQVGRPDEALNQYQACSRVLKRELGLAPEDETTRLRDTIVEGLRRTAQRPTAGAALRGDNEAEFSPRDDDVVSRAKQTREVAQRVRAELRERWHELCATFEANSRQMMTFKRLVLSTSNDGSDLPRGGALRGDGEAAFSSRDEVMSRAEFSPRDDDVVSRAKQTRERAQRLMTESLKGQRELLAAFEDNGRQTAIFKRLVFGEKADSENRGTTNPA